MTVHTVRGAFFAPTEFSTLWAPCSAARPAAAPAAAAAVQLPGLLSAAAAAALPALAPSDRGGLVAGTMLLFKVRLFVLIDGTVSLERFFSPSQWPAP